MKIGILTETFLPQINGVVVSICNLNRILIKKHNITVFTTGERKQVSHEILNGYDIYRFRSVIFRPYPEYRILLPNHESWNKIKSNQFDILHSRTPFTLGIIAKKYAQTTQTPLVGTFDTPIFDYIHYIPFFGSVQPTKYFLQKIAKTYS